MESWLAKKLLRDYFLLLIRNKKELSTLKNLSNSSFPNKLLKVILAFLWFFYRISRIDKENKNKGNWESSIRKSSIFALWFQQLIKLSILKSSKRKAFIVNWINYSPYWRNKLRYLGIQLTLHAIRFRWRQEFRFTYRKGSQVKVWIRET